MDPATLPAPDHRRRSPAPPRRAPHRAAAVTALAIAALYGLLAVGVLDLGAAETGELGILGVAGGVHLLLAVGLWLWPRRVLLTATVLLQLALAAMYVAIAPERDPHYEVWGVSIRVLSTALIVLAILAMVRGAGRPEGTTDPGNTASTSPPA